MTRLNACRHAHPCLLMCRQQHGLLILKLQKLLQPLKCFSVNLPAEIIQGAGPDYRLGSVACLLNGSMHLHRARKESESNWWLSDSKAVFIMPFVNFLIIFLNALRYFVKISWLFSRRNSVLNLDSETEPGVAGQMPLIFLKFYISVSWFFYLYKNAPNIFYYFYNAS